MERRALDEFVRRVRGLGGRSELEAAALELAEEFESAGVDYLLLKGPALARMLYTAGEHRGYKDIDFLLPPDQVAAGRRILSRLGYLNASEARGIVDVADVVHGEIWVRPNQRIGPLMVDLHRFLAGAEAPAPLVWSALAGRRVWMDFGGRRAAVLDREGLALHLATHASQHGPDDLQALGDLTRGLERLPAPAWHGAAELAREVQAQAAFAAGLRLVPAGAALAQELGLPESGRLDWEIRHRDIRPRGTFHVLAFGEARGISARLTVLRRALFPTREWLQYEHPWARRGRARLTAARALHLLRAPVWAAAALRFRWRGRRAAPESADR